MKPGTKVRVTFPARSGCPCGCGRFGSYEGTVTQGDTRYRKILVQGDSGKRFYEYPECVKEIT